MGEFTDLDGAAEFLGLSKRVVRELGDRGEIPMFRVGPSRGRIRFKVADLRTYVEGGLVRPVIRTEPSSHRKRLFGRPDGKPLRYL